MFSNGSTLPDPFSGSGSPEDTANTTSSAVSVRAGEHLFKVSGHSRIKGSNTSLKSKQFRVGGHEWAILYYPNGCPSVADGQFTSVFLRLMSATKREVNVSYTFCLQDPMAPLTGEKYKIDSTYSFSSDAQCYGRPMFVSRADLAASGCLKDDSLVIKCYVEVMDKPEDDDDGSIIVPPSELKRDLHNLFEGSHKADLTILVGRFKTFKAHAGILAVRSPVFYAELCGSMVESKENTIQIEGMGAKVFEILLYYIYNDCLPVFMDEATKEATNMAQHLLVAADRYAIERLKVMCESKLSKTLAISSVGYTLNLAEQYNCDQLKAHCLKYIGKHRQSCSLTRSPAAVVTKTYSTVLVHSGEHRFKVFRHSRIKGTKTRLTSKTFRVGGHEWAIDYYPNGDCSSVYLTLVSTNESEVTTSASFCLQDVASPALGTGEKNKKSLAIKFSPSKTRNGKTFGIREFVSKADLAASGCLDNDCLVIKCSIVIQDCVDDDDIVEAPPSDLSKDLSSLLERGFKADITVRVGSIKSFKVHGCMLAARSPVFRAQLCGFMRESKQSIINIDDMDPDIFEVLLHYIYNDCLPDFMDGPTEEAKNIVQHLLVAADRYAVQRLKQICESTRRQYSGFHWLLRNNIIVIASRPMFSSI
ncbi:unnamed protein product [Alopecurus aequalis]